MYYVFVWLSLLYVHVLVIYFINVYLNNLINFVMKTYLFNFLMQWADCLHRRINCKIDKTIVDDFKLFSGFIDALVCCK